LVNKNRIERTVERLILELKLSLTNSLKTLNVMSEKSCSDKPVLYSAPPIPAGIHQNPQESAGMGPESTGIHRNGTGIRWIPVEWDQNRPGN
jgi:hypothetical protein